MGRRRKYNTRRKNRRHTFRARKQKRSLKMTGGTLEDLERIDISKKTIILMGEEHTMHNKEEYDETVAKQTRIIDLLTEKFKGHIVFYSEAPKDKMEMIMTDSQIHSSKVIQFAHGRLPTVLSSVVECDRTHGQCDDRYATEILDIIKRPDISCVIVQMGLLHLPQIKKLIQAQMEDVQIVIMNTVSSNQLTSARMHEMKEKYPEVAELLKTEPPYRLPIFIAEVVKNSYGDEVYKCPKCGAMSSSAAKYYPHDTSLFIHAPGCENAHKGPKEYKAPIKKLNAREMALARIEGRIPRE